MLEARQSVGQIAAVKTALTDLWSWPGLPVSTATSWNNEGTFDLQKTDDLSDLTTHFTDEGQ